MVRIKRGNVAVKRRKKYLKLAKGYIGTNSRLSTFATEQVVQSLQYAYISRRLKKRQFRRFWITRINITSRFHQNTYSKFMGALRGLNIFLNRKILAFLAFHDNSIFSFLNQESRQTQLVSL